MAISDKHLPELDGLRGIAILLVLTWHFTGMLVDPDQGVIQYLAWRYTIFGQSGVDLFFVLSGFLIIGILIDNRDRQNYFRTFYARRALRILPPYLILIAGFWICVRAGLPHFDDQIPLWSLLTFTQNWIMASIHTFGPTSIAGTWSLAIEEQFYLLVPALVLLLPPRLLPKTLVAIGIFSVVARSACFYLWPDNAYAPYVLTPLRLDGLCAGGLIAIAYRSPAIWTRISDRRAMLLVLFSSLAALIPFYTWWLRTDFAWSVLYHFGHAYLSAFYGVALIGVLLWAGTPSSRWLRSKVLTYTGLISYSLYLFQSTFKGLFFFATGHGNLVMRTPLDAVVVAGALISTFVFCALLYRYLERPAQRIGRLFQYEKAGLNDSLRSGTAVP